MKINTVTTPIEFLARLFPFHILLDGEMKIKKTGKGMYKLLQKDLQGEFFLSKFEIKMPFIKEPAYDALLKRQGKPILIEEKSSQISFRGELVAIDEKEESFISFVGTPVLRNLELFKSTKLKINDFALYDGLPDTLFLLQSQKKLISDTQKLSEKLQIQKRQLEKKNEELQEFAYVVSHDLKAPLRSISTLATFLEEDMADVMTEDDKENMTLLKGRVTRMGGLIKGILEYSRIDGKVDDIEPLDLNILIGDIRDSMMGLTNKPFEMKFKKPLPIVPCSKVRGQQVFQNLISNAIKYNDKPVCKIVIDAVETETGYQFSVEDNGPGIAEKYRGKVFGMFQTLQARDKFESTGVGLSIVKKIIEEEARGKIWIESEEGKFTRFVFTWNGKK